MQKVLRFFKLNLFLSINIHIIACMKTKINMIFKTILIFATICFIIATPLTLLLGDAFYIKYSGLFVLLICLIYAIIENFDGLFS